jgi:hypothetical protein
LDHHRPTVKKKQFGGGTKTAIRAEAHGKPIEIQGLSRKSSLRNGTRYAGAALLLN